MIAFGRAAASGRYRKAVMAMFAQGGKALALDTPIPTPSGWTTMGDLKAGDALFAPTGEVCHVVEAFPVRFDRPCFRVEFCDGSSIVADAEHKWEVYEQAGRARWRTRVLTTADMVEAGVDKGERSRFAVRVTDPISAPDAALPIAPYVLGAWLGDGRTDGAEICAGDQDVEEMTANLRARGVTVDLVRQSTAWRLVLRTDVVGKHAGTFRALLRDLGVLGDKHIPPSYLRASVGQRLELLRGIMDTDGTVDPRGRCEATFKSEVVARGLVELLCSLGFRPKLARRVLSDGYVCYRVSFTGGLFRHVFGLTRKQARLDAARPSRPTVNNRRFIRAIVDVPSVPVRCIAVDSPSRLFLAGERMIPTHNSETLLDIIGQRLDQAPVPMLYIGPNKQFLTEQWEPRIADLLDQAPTLAGKVARGKKMTKTKKLISGVPLRLAHGGSSTALKSDPAGLVITDEADELLANVKGQGDPIALGDARGDTFADFCHAITSTPSKGPKETMRDEATGLEFWAPQDTRDLDSKIWSLWQEGTRYHWTWKCPHCGERFVPRFDCLMIPDIKTTTPDRARHEAYLICPRNGCAIGDEYRAAMNETGVYIAPGMTIDEHGNPVGSPPENTTASFWVSGLCSPFKTFGERAEEYLKAVRSGDQQTVQTVINAGFGELWSPVGGDVPEWEEVRRLALPYQRHQVPAEAMVLVAGVDVQKNRLVFVIRAFGARQESWLINEGEIWGDTSLDEVWLDLYEVISARYGGLHVKAVFVDAGFRPGKKDLVPEHKVYAFARLHKRFVWACKGYDRRAVPLSRNQIDVKAVGRGAPSFSLELVRLDADFMKSWVHSRLRWPEDQPGGWHLHQEVSEEYCKQIVSEARVRKPSGGFQWVTTFRDNHFLDCFDPETELLTDAGWMPVADAVRYGGNFATVNLETDLIEYQRATHAVEREHDGEMIEIKGRGIDMLVTPNHRMVTQRRNPVDETPRITLAGDLTVWHTLKKTAGWVGIDPGPISFPAVEIAIPGRGPLRQPALTVEAGDWFEFLGWFVSEGHVRVRGNSRGVVITQNPGEKQDRIRALLDRMGLRYRITSGRQIVVTSRAVFDAVADCADPGEGGACYRKRVPALVRNGTPDLIDRFVEAAILGDGWRQDGFRTYATTSRKLADDMQELFLKLGRSANVRAREVPPCRIRGCSSATAVQFHVSETTTKQASLRRSDNAPLFRQVAYRGPVYCVTVPNGTLIARRSGLPLVVGNCEALAYAAAYMLGIERLPAGARPPPRASSGDAPEPRAATPPAPVQPPRPKPQRQPGGGWLGNTRGFLG